MRVLVDGRVAGLDGIGRYTRCVGAALTAQRGPGIDIKVLGPTGTPRYSREEGEELLRAAGEFRADVIHALDYRIPIAEIEPAIVTTVHDLLRLEPRTCYSDEQFAQRFGHDGLLRLQAALTDLRTRTEPPHRDAQEELSAHAEFYARMLEWTLARSRTVIVPTAVVAGHCAARLRTADYVAVSPWGIDHDRYDPRWACGSARPLRLDAGGRYLLYVGQARGHKQLPALVAGYLSSRAPEKGVDLVCAGGDFAPGTATSTWLAEQTCRRVHLAGPVSDRSLRALYRGAEVLVHVAEHEGFGFTPLEALAHGTRVIAGDIPVLRETLGSHARFVNPHDQADIAAAINMVLACPDSGGERQARARWAARYRWERHAKDLLGIYAEARR